MDWTKVSTKAGDEIARVRWDNDEETAFVSDDDGENPREWDNIGHLCMWHNRYTFPCETAPHGWYSERRIPELDDFLDWCYEYVEAGDYGKNCAGIDVVTTLGVEWVIMHGDKWLELALQDQVECEPWQVRLVKRAIAYVEKNYVYEFVGLYDHSGLSVSHCGRNYSGWDHGVVGCHYIELDELQATGIDSDDLRATATKILEGELQEYDNYVSGRVIGFIHYDDQGEETDSCWGFLVDDFRAKTLVEAVRDNLVLGGE